MEEEEEDYMDDQHVSFFAGEEVTSNRTAENHQEEKRSTQEEGATEEGPEVQQENALQQSSRQKQKKFFSKKSQLRLIRDLGQGGETVEDLLQKVAQEEKYEDKLRKKKKTLETQAPQSLNGSSLSEKLGAVPRQNPVRQKEQEPQKNDLIIKIRRPTPPKTQQGTSERTPNTITIPAETINQPNLVVALPRSARSNNAARGKATLPESSGQNRAEPPQSNKIILVQHQHQISQKVGERAQPVVSIQQQQPRNPEAPVSPRQRSSRVRVKGPLSQTKALDSSGGKTRSQQQQHQLQLQQ